MEDKRRDQAFCEFTDKYVNTVGFESNLALAFTVAWNQQQKQIDSWMETCKQWQLDCQRKADEIERLQNTLDKELNRSERLFEKVHHLQIELNGVARSRQSHPHTVQSNPDPKIGSIGPKLTERQDHGLDL